MSGGTVSSPPLSISGAQVRAFRLRRHHLLHRSPRRSLVGVAGHIGGVQAQVLSAAGLALLARVEGLRSQDVEAALGKNRRLSRAWCMRRTLHLVPSSELAVFARGTSKRADRDVTWLRNRGVSLSHVRTLVEAVLSTLEVPCTRDELAEGVARATGSRLVVTKGGGWGSSAQISCVKFRGFTYPSYWLLHLVGAFGVVCYGHDRAGQPTYVRGDRWVPTWREVTVEGAEETLLRRYLGAYGPATREDFAFWTGMRLRDAQRVWGRLGDEVLEVSVDGRAAAILQKDQRELERGPDGPAPTRLLPYFDAFVLGHRSKRHLIGPDHHGKVYRPQGWVAPVLLLEGRIAGVWEHEVQGDRLSITVRPLSSLSSLQRRELEDEAGRVGDFLGTRRSELSVRSSTR